MTIRSTAATAAWRRSLEMASFRDVPFHVETSGRTSGRRTISHEYPKRNDPYAEDMGRHAVRFMFTGYIIMDDHGLYGDVRRSGGGAYPTIIAHRNALISALEQDGSGYLVHPTLSRSYSSNAPGASAGGPMLVMCERYTVSETRERGGYYEFDMGFVEAGFVPRPYTVDTKGNLLSAATSAENSAGRSLQSNLEYISSPADMPFVIQRVETD